MDLIKVTKTDDGAVVSSRELHEYLSMKTPYRIWMPRMIDYGFKEGEDYTPYFFVHPQNGQQIQDYALTLDCAKHIAMIQRTQKGMEVRNYFIRKEKEMRQSIRPKSPAETALAMAQALVDHEDRIKKLEAQSTTRPEAYSIAGYASLIGRSVNLKHAATLGRKASRLCRERGIEPDTTHDPRFGKVKVYPVEILKKTFEQV